MTLAELKPLWNSVVTLRTTDGEVLKAKIVWVDEEYDDIIVEVIDTNQPDHYKDPKAVYTVNAADILTVETSS